MGMFLLPLPSLPGLGLTTAVFLSLRLQLLLTSLPSENEALLESLIREVTKYFNKN